MTHARQSSPDSGIGVQGKVLEICLGVSASLGSGTGAQPAIWHRIRALPPPTYQDLRCTRGGHCDILEIQPNFGFRGSAPGQSQHRGRAPSCADTSRTSGGAKGTRGRNMGRRWRSNPSGKCLQEQLTRGTDTSTMRKAAHLSGCARCGAGSGCSAMTYRSLGVPFSLGSGTGAEPRPVSSPVLR